MPLHLLRTGGLVLLFLARHLAVAQPVAIGIEGGVRATEDVSGALTPESKRYIVGPKLEIRLPWRLSVEFDALYRYVGFTNYLNPCCLTSSLDRERLNSWEFPTILKYRLRGLRPLHPFVGLGYSLRILYGSAAGSQTYVNLDTGTLTYLSGKGHGSYPTTHGFVVSGGVEFGAHHLLISPELRYVHWNADFLTDFGSEGPGFYYPNSVPQNEVFVLVGVAWH